MKAIAGLAVIVMAIGTLVVARATGVTTPGMQTVEVMESQSDDAPFISVDPEDWR